MSKNGVYRDYRVYLLVLFQWNNDDDPKHQNFGVPYYRPSKLESETSLLGHFFAGIPTSWNYVKWHVAGRVHGKSSHGGYTGYTWLHMVTRVTELGGPLGCPFLLQPPGNPGVSSWSLSIVSMTWVLCPLAPAPSCMADGRWQNNWLVVTGTWLDDMTFQKQSGSWECHHPNISQLTHLFQRVRAQPPTR